MLSRKVVNCLLIPAFVVSVGTKIVSAQENKNVFETKISCGGVDSKIETVCEKKSYYNDCSSHKWTVFGKTVELLQDYFVLYKWACLPSNKGDKIILWSANGGSCDECERWEVWNPDGTKLVDWKNFWEEYKNLKFPETNNADESDKQFNYVNKGLDKKPLN